MREEIEIVIAGRELGKRLYDLIRAPKRFVSVAGAGHNDLAARAVSAAKEFIAERNCSTTCPRP